MEEAIVDVALDLNPLPEKHASQEEARQNTRADQGPETSWLRKRAAQVEALRQSIANGSYRVDSAELARCILRNSTGFLQTSFAVAETR